MQSVVKSINFQKALDTKTNPRIAEGFLELENCIIENYELKKDTGYDIAIENSGTSVFNSTPKSIFNENERLNAIFGDVAYSADLDNKAFSPKCNMPFLERTDQNTVYLNTDLPLGYTNGHTVYIGEYGDFRCISTGLRTAKLYSISKNTVLKEVTTNNPIVAIVGTNKGIYLYDSDNAAAANNKEYFISFEESYPVRLFTSPLPILTYPTVILPYKLPIITCEYDGNLIWICYVDVTGQPQVVVRDGYGNNTKVFTPAATGLPVTNRATTSPYAKLSLCSTFWNKTIVPHPLKNINGLLMIVVYNVVSIFETTTLSNIAAVTFDPGINVADNFTQSICYDAIANGIVLLQEDLLESQGIIRKSPPFFVKYDISSGVWVKIIRNPVIEFPNWTNGSVLLLPAYIYGTIFTTGGLWATEDNYYFMISTIPQPDHSGSGFTSVDPSQIHCNYIIIDKSFNVVDHNVHYIGSKQKYFDIGTDNHVYGPWGPVVTKENQATSSISYISYQINNTVIFSNPYKTDDKIVVHNFKKNPKAKLSSSLYSVNGYFGYNNLYKMTTGNAFYANLLDYPVAFLDFVENTGFATFYSYSITFEYTDDSGEITRSYNSVPVGGNIKLSPTNPKLYYSPPSPAEGNETITIRIWRTTENATTYHLLASIKFDPFFFQPYTDPNTLDADLEKNPISYFTGGVLGELPFESFSSFTSHQNRFFAVKLESRNKLQYSFLFQPTVSPATTFGFEIQVPSLGGDIVSIVSLDQALIIFKQDYIFELSGDGPDGTGNNSTFYPVQLVNSPVGCTDKNSIVRTPSGVLFKSRQGIWMIDRSLTVSYIGAAVEAFNNLTISDAIVLQTKNRVKFFTYEGLNLTYDFIYNQWTSADADIIYSATVLNGQIFRFDATNKLFADNTSYLRNNKNYIMKLTTPWIKLAGVQGYERVRRIMLNGEFKASRTLKVEIFYDYIEVPEYFEYFNKDVENQYGVGNWGALVPFAGEETILLEVRIDPPRQKCLAMKIRISDESNPEEISYGDSFTLTEILFVGVPISDNVPTGTSKRASY